MKFPAAEDMKESSLVSYLLKIKQMILDKVSEGECSIVIPKNDIFSIATLRSFLSFTTCSLLLLFAYNNNNNK
jgi:hypothetical protein